MLRVRVLCLSGLSSSPMCRVCVLLPQATPPRPPTDYNRGRSLKDSVGGKKAKRSMPRWNSSTSTSTSTASTTLDTIEYVRQTGTTEPERVFLSGSVDLSARAPMVVRAHMACILIL